MTKRIVPEDQFHGAGPVRWYFLGGKAVWRFDSGSAKDRALKRKGNWHPTEKECLLKNGILYDDIRETYGDDGEVSKVTHTVRYVGSDLPYRNIELEK